MFSAGKIPVILNFSIHSIFIFAKKATHHAGFGHLGCFFYVIDVEKSRLLCTLKLSHSHYMPEHNIRIRPATLTDIPAIHALMFELAVYEKSPESVATTIEEYQTDFEAGRFESMVAEIDGQVVGMTLFFMTYSSWKGKMLYLDDFVVTQTARRWGVGQLLYDAFLEEGKKRGCRLVKWQVLDWNEPAIKFYEKNEAIIERDWWNVKRLL
jgi:GNAT superfamily N-acetyltransferase